MSLRNTFRESYAFQYSTFSIQCQFSDTPGPLFNFVKELWSVQCKKQKIQRCLGGRGEIITKTTRKSNFTANCLNTFVVYCSKAQDRTTIVCSVLVAGCKICKDTANKAIYIFQRIIYSMCILTYHFRFNNVKLTG